MTTDEITDCARLLHQLAQTDSEADDLSPSDLLVFRALSMAKGDSKRQILMKLIERLLEGAQP